MGAGARCHVPDRRQPASERPQRRHCPVVTWLAERLGEAAGTLRPRLPAPHSPRLLAHENGGAARSATDRRLVDRLRAVLKLASKALITLAYNAHQDGGSYSTTLSRSALPVLSRAAARPVADGRQHGTAAARLALIWRQGSGGVRARHGQYELLVVKVCGSSSSRPLAALVQPAPLWHRAGEAPSSFMTL